jgi:hypothetical protein
MPVDRAGRSVRLRRACLVCDGIGSGVLFLAIEHFVPACFMMSTLLLAQERYDLRIHLL